MKTNVLFSYKELKEKLPLSHNESLFLAEIKKTIKNIFLKKEKQLVVFVGPCSIHDEASAILYAKKLKELRKDLKNVLLIMRVFFEKSRSANSWKGYLYDPDLNNSFNIEMGIIKARKLLLRLAKLHIPVCCEFLDPNASCYFDDLISWGFIGARTASSSFHRQFASSLSIPIGFKNSLDGDIRTAVNGAIVAANAQNYIGIDINGKICQISTGGNDFSHIVLRGSNTSANYDEKSVKGAVFIMKEKNADFPIVIDCSHGNARNDHKNQTEVFEYAIQNLLNKNYPVIGLMLESHIYEGKQAYNPLNLRFGLSITDPCLGFEKTEELIVFADEFIKTSRLLLQD